MHARDMAPGREVSFSEWHLRLPTGEGSLLTLSLRGLLRTEKKVVASKFQPALPWGRVSSLGERKTEVQY